MVVSEFEARVTLGDKLFLGFKKTFQAGQACC